MWTENGNQLNDHETLNLDNSVEMKLKKTF